MNEASRWRRDRGDEIAALYAERAGVRAVLLGGSAARGEADTWSDLDLIVVWDEPDAPFLDAQPLARLGARRFTYAPTDEVGSRLEQYFLGALKIDVASGARATLERIFADVLERGELDARKHKTLATFADCVALRGEDELERLRERRAEGHPGSARPTGARAHTRAGAHRARACGGDPRSARRSVRTDRRGARLDRKTPARRRRSPRAPCSASS